MNLRQPYEQLIADKLRQLPAPDADASWLQMKRLLDDDEETGGGGRKRPPGNNGWWRIGIIAIVVSASFWLYVDQKPAPASLSKNNAATMQPAAGETNNLNKTQTATIDKTTTLTGSDVNTTNAANNKEPGHVTADKLLAATVVENNNTNPVIEKNISIHAADHAIALASDNKENAGLSVKNNAAKKLINKNAADNAIRGGSPVTQNNFQAISLSAKENKLASSKKHTAGNALTNNTIAGSFTDADEFAQTTTLSSNQRKHTIKHNAGKLTSNSIWDDKTIVGDDDSKKTDNNKFAAANRPVSAKEKDWFARLTELKTIVPAPSFNTSLSAGDSIENTRSISNLLNSETKKLVVKAQRDKAIALLDKKDKKSLHLNLGNLFKPFSMHINDDPWWAAGIALNSPVTVNTQNRYNYNVNAKSSIITDYIPSPYLQFHLNNYVYLQTELNFSTPQYTPQLLVYRQNNDLAAQSGVSMSRQKSIYIQKMYYFNWPVSLHYSPINNLYFSGGLQFSSFQSGLASIEEREYATASGPDHASSVTNNILKFKDDSIAAKIRPNEWRWQVGAEYYWNRFSVGLRYNQAFKNTINTTASPVLPPTISRNESLLFFVRYNLFESRQKESSSLKNQ